MFERLADGYQLTQAGEELQQYVSRIDEETGSLQLHLTGKDFKPSGMIRITAPDNIAYSYLPEYYKTFSEQYSAIALELIVSNDDFDLSRREADLAIRATPQPPEHLIGRKIFSLPWGFYASKAYLRLNGEPTNQHDLSNHRLIGADGVITRLPAFRWLQKTIPDTIAMLCSNLVGMAAVDNGIALLPGDQRQSELVRLFSLEPMVTSDLWLLTHPELRRIKRISLLMKHLLDAFHNDARLKKIAIYPE